MKVNCDNPNAMSRLKSNEDVWVIDDLEQKIMVVNLMHAEYHNDRYISIRGHLSVYTEVYTTELSAWEGLLENWKNTLKMRKLDVARAESSIHKAEKTIRSIEKAIKRLKEKV